MNPPEPIFAGFFPKRTRAAPDSFGNTDVREICSVSACISEGPPDWIEQWKHNTLGFYDSEELARAVTGDASAEYDLYAYRLFPLLGYGDKIETVTVENRTDILPADYDFLGYDIVTRSGPSFFDCSPLSCNNGARVYAVNEYCLIANRTQAFQALLEISMEGTYEPGPYYLFEVHRKRRRGQPAGSYSAPA